MSRMIIAIAVPSVFIMAILGTLTQSPDMSEQFVGRAMPDAVDFPYFPLAAGPLRATTWFKRTAPILGQAFYGIQICAGDSEGENGDDKNGNDKSDESGGGPDRLWDVVLYG